MSTIIFRRLTRRGENIARLRLFRPAAQCLEKALNRTFPHCDKAAGCVATRILRALRARCLLLDKGCLLRGVELKGQDRDGTERHVLYLGEQEARSWFASLILPRGSAETELPPVRPWHLRRSVDAARSSYDLVVLELNRLLSGRIDRRTSWSLPRWVRLVIPIPSTWEEMMRGFRKSTQTQIRAVRNRPFTFDVTRDKAAFDEFYDQLYVPLIAARHGDQAIFYRREQLFGYFRKGVVLRVFESGRWVSGAINAVCGRQSRCFVMGVRDGDPALLKRNALKAVYYFMVEWAMEQGLTSLDMGRTRPLFEDGVFRQKRKWGGRLVADPWEEAVIHVLPGKTQGLFADLPLRHPFLEQLENEFRPACGSRLLCRRTGRSSTSCSSSTGAPA